MYISRLVVKGFRNFKTLDIAMSPGVTCIVGENNSGKSNLIDAFRLAIDANLTSTRRQLTPEDLSVGTDYTVPIQALISIEFSGFETNPAEEALVFGFHIASDVARITYRFRPKREIRSEISEGIHPGTGLSIDDYRWEIMGGGAIDPLSVTWSEDFGKSVRFEELQQSYLVVFMEALRDVEQRLRQSRQSPLARLLTSADIPETEQEKLVKVLSKANDQISGSATIKNLGTELTDSFSLASGEAYKMGVSLGMASPTFGDISRSLTVLLSDDVMTNISTAQNGLGLNNILYISMLLQYFRRRVKEAKSAGQLLIIEEPESHLHPQLQRVLFGALRDEPFQTIVTTHSTHITSAADLSSIVVLTRDEKGATSTCVPATAAGMPTDEIADLERYLDATRGVLLYAKKVMLVEGPAELFLIPRLVKTVMNIDVDEIGVSVVPIYGVHFASYAKLFGKNVINRKCAITADADIKPSDASEEGVEEVETVLPTKANITALENDYVRAFLGKTTFERELVAPGTLRMFEKAATEAGAPKIAKQLRLTAELVEAGKLIEPALTVQLEKSRTSVLALAKRVGKARFAQITSKYAELATELPAYIRNAIDWLRT